MAGINDAAVYETLVKGISQGQAVLNVLHYRWDKAGGPEVADTEETFLNNFRTAWQTAVLPKLSIEYFATEYVVFRITGVENNPAPPPPRRFTIPFAHAVSGIDNVDEGTRIGPALPTFTAIGYRKRTDTFSRNYRGGMRLSPALEADTVDTGNQWTAAAQGLFDGPTLAPLLTVSAGGGAPPGMRLVVFSKTLALAQVTVLPTTYTRFVTGFTLNVFTTSQVSRKQRPAGGG